MKLRIVVFGIVGFAALVVLFPILKERYILHKIWTDSVFKEFKRCKLVDYSFNVLEDERFTLLDQYVRTYRNAVFTFIDTVSKHNITYHYEIYIGLERFNVSYVLLEALTEITTDKSMADIIAKMESDTALSVLIENSDVKTCIYNSWNFVFTGDTDIVKYHIGYGISYFKTRKPTPKLSSVRYYSTFLESVGKKGFAVADFDSLTFSRYVAGYGDSIMEIWRLQGFSHLCGNDFCEVSRDGDSPVGFQWHTRRDTIIPGFAEPLIMKVLRATGLAETYRRGNLVLNKTVALRYADYYKRDDVLVDASRIAGCYRYHWRTGTWIDDIGDGLHLKVFFTYYMDKRKLEMVRIGFSADNFFDKVTLHPLSDVIDFDKIRQIAPGLNTQDIKFTLSQNGDVAASFVYEWSRYEVNVETAITKKSRHPSGMRTGFVPDDRHIYSAVESLFREKR
jgi:hypothetical protein